MNVELVRRTAFVQLFSYRVEQLTSGTAKQLFSGTAEHLFRGQLNCCSVEQ